eukprot:1835565-Amphidinium_carterae.1
MLKPPDFVASARKDSCCRACVLPGSLQHLRLRLQNRSWPSEYGHWIGHARLGSNNMALCTLLNLLTMLACPRDMQLSCHPANVSCGKVAVAICSSGGDSGWIAVQNEQTARFKVCGPCFLYPLWKELRTQMSRERCMGGEQGSLELAALYCICLQQHCCSEHAGNEQMLRARTHPWP